MTDEPAATVPEGVVVVNQAGVGVHDAIIIIHATPGPGGAVVDRAVADVQSAAIEDAAAVVAANQLNGAMHDLETLQPGIDALPDGEHALLLAAV